MAKPTTKQKRSKTLLPLIALLVVVASLGAGLLIHASSIKPHETEVTTLTKTTKNAVATPTTKPEPAAPINGGDAAKTQVSNETAMSSTSSSSNSSSGGVTGLAVTVQGGGTIHIANQLSGATEDDNCNVVLTNPSGATRTVTGTVLYSGTYYLCSFGTIANVTTTGTWQAMLMVTDTNNKLIGSGTTSFTVSAS